MLNPYFDAFACCHCMTLHRMMSIVCDIAEKGGMKSVNIVLVGISMNTRKLASFDIPTQENIHQYQCGSHIVSYCSISSRFTQFVSGRVAQLVTCLASDASLTSDPGVTSSIPARSHTFVEIDHEIISTVILLHSAESFKKGCCQLQVKVCAQSTG